MSLNILFNKSAISSLVFVDFITVTKYPNLTQFQKYDSIGFNLWTEAFAKNEENFKGTAEEYYHTKSCFNPIYSTIVGAAIGAFVKEENGEINSKIKTLAVDSEAKLLGLFTSVLYNAYDKNKILAGHNISGYHIPFYTKRFFAKENMNKVIAKDLKGEQVIASFPAIISEHLMAKPWEQKILDTMQLTKFGSYYNTSLEQLLYHFNIETQILRLRKEDASKTYWDEILKSTSSLEIAVLNENTKMASLASEYVSATMSTYQYLRNAL